MVKSESNFTTGGYEPECRNILDLFQLVEIGRYPILWHIMNSYASYGHKDFYVALGYKADVVRQYFHNITP